MISKTYKSRNDLAFSVMVDGRCKFISFIPYSYGGSTYTTQNKSIQKALDDKIAGGNARFWLESQKVEDEPEAEPQGTVANPEEKPQEQKAEEEKEESVLTEVKVNDIEEARDYLIEKFGAEKKSVRTISGVGKVAAANNIKFVGI